MVKIESDNDYFHLLAEYREIVDTYNQRDHITLPMPQRYWDLQMVLNEYARNRVKSIHDCKESRTQKEGSTT